jgi:hypothetical protein
MSGEATSTGLPETSVADDQAIRERVRALMGQFLQQGQIDPEGVREVMQTVTGGVPLSRTSTADASGMEFTEEVRQLGAVLVISAEAARRALETVANRGNDITENDVKGALASLMKVQDDCQAAMNRVGERASANLRRELSELAMHAQNVGIEASARASALMNELARRMAGTYQESAAPSLEAARAFSTRMALLTSGIIAGVADALSDQSGSKKAK